jgi:hypothetical protein
MMTPSGGGAERRTPCPAGAQARSDRTRRRRHRHPRAAPPHRATLYDERYPSFHVQLYLFNTAAPSDPLLGLAVKLPNTCSKCADLVAIIGPGKPPIPHRCSADRAGFTAAGYRARIARSSTR